MKASLSFTQLLILAVLGLIALASIIVTVLVAYPFAPYTVYKTSVLPSEVCPLEEVRVSGDSEVAEGWRLNRIEVESVWEPEDPSMPPQSGGTGTIFEPEARPRSTVVSTVVRNAPRDPGEYRLSTEAHVYGTFGSGPFGGFPKNQQLSYTSKDVTRVMEPDSPECRTGESDSEETT